MATPAVATPTMMRATVTVVHATVVAVVVVAVQSLSSIVVLASSHVHSRVWVLIIPHGAVSPALTPTGNAIDRQ